jgi:hypothetical protein
MRQEWQRCLNLCLPHHKACNLRPLALLLEHPPVDLLGQPDLIQKDMELFLGSLYV